MGEIAKGGRRKQYNGKKQKGEQGGRKKTFAYISGNSFIVSFIVI